MLLREPVFFEDEIAQLRSLFGAKGLTLEDRLRMSSPNREAVQKLYSAIPSYGGMTG